MHKPNRIMNLKKIREIQSNSFSNLTFVLLILSSQYLQITKYIRVFRGVFFIVYGYLVTLQFERLLNDFKRCITKMYKRRTVWFMKPVNNA